MNKSDYSIHNICIAAIKRKTIEPYNFKWTRFYETPTAFFELYADDILNPAENELVICATIISSNNFSVLTSQRLITKENGILSFGTMNGGTIKHYGDFKSCNNGPVTFGKIQLNNGDKLKYFIETGRASMVMIYGVRTLISIKSQNDFFI